MSVDLRHGDCREVIKSLADCSIHSVVTDPPYSLVSIQKRFGKPGSAAAQEGRDGLYRRASAGFMGKQWDTGETAFDPAWWAEVYRVMKPGAHLVAFSGTRTYHRMACAIEDAGFEIRDQLAWAYGAGFPKSHDVSKGIDKQGGHERATIRTPIGKESSSALTVGGDKRGASRPWVERAKMVGYHEAASPEAASPEAALWQGWGTALKPSWEPIVLARKPLIGTVAANVLQHGTGGINIDGCRIGFASDADQAAAAAAQRLGQDHAGRGRFNQGDTTGYQDPAGSLEGWQAKQDLGRWPANLCHDGSNEVLAAFPSSGSAINSRSAEPYQPNGKNAVYGEGMGGGYHPDFADAGSAARFFFSGKAGPDDRCDSRHPTVKPVSLMRWLARLITPPGGLVLDPFAGSGTTGVACIREGFDCILIEREDEYAKDIRHRIDKLSGLDTELFSALRTADQGKLL